MGSRTEELVFSMSSWAPGGSRTRERAGKAETSQRQMHFIDKATASEGMRQRPHLARATLGVGVLIHIETQAELSPTS